MPFRGWVIHCIRMHTSIVFQHNIALHDGDACRLDLPSRYDASTDWASQTRLSIVSGIITFTLSGRSYRLRVPSRCLYRLRRDLRFNDFVVMRLARFVLMTAPVLTAWSFVEVSPREMEHSAAEQGYCSTVEPNYKHRFYDSGKLASLSHNRRKQWSGESLQVWIFALNEQFSQARWVKTLLWNHTQTSVYIPVTYQSQAALMLRPPPFCSETLPSNLLLCKRQYSVHAFLQKASIGVWFQKQVTSYSHPTLNGSIPSLFPWVKCSN